jgi:hypothetical protein
MMQPAMPAPKPVPTALEGLRVLFLPKNSRVPYFKAFIGAASREYNWTINIVCPAISERMWRQTVAGTNSDFTLVPDFNDVSVWENDGPAVAEIEGFVAECERATGIPASRIILAGERDIGRGLSIRNYYWFRNKTARRVLSDNAMPFQIVRRMFAFARDTLRKTKPDFVIAGEWADPLCFTFYVVAQQMGIRCVVNRPSKVWSGRCFWSDEPLMYNATTRSNAAARRASNAPTSAEAQDRIAAFRARPSTLGYVRENWNTLDRRGWLAHHATLARAFAVELRHRWQRRSGPAPKPALQLVLEHYRRPLRRWRQSAYFRRMSEQELCNRKYIYIAMHKDPEQALNHQAPFWSNQYNTVALLAAALPSGYRLLVREHRNNLGRRPTRYYKEMSRLPNVTLIDGLDDQFKYIRNAELVVTENGTTGWEGLLLGRRVITLADNFFDATELARRVRDPERIAAIIVEMLKDPPVKDTAAHDRALGWIIDAERETTVPLAAADQKETFDLLADLLQRCAAASAKSALSPA